MNTPTAIDFNSFINFSEEDNTIVVDTRHQSEFLNSHVPNSLFLGIDGPFEIWSKLLLIDNTKQIVLICPVHRENETIEKLLSFGINNIIGFLEGGYNTYSKNSGKIASITSITADTFKEELQNDSIVYDVRKHNEYENSHLKCAIHSPLNTLSEHLSSFPKDLKTPFYIFCGGGYRSVITASILKSKGYINPIDIKGGFKAIKTSGIDTSS